jgi:hypothetical protein
VSIAKNLIVELVLIGIPVIGEVPFVLDVVGVDPSVVKNIIPGADAVSVTDWGEVYVPPDGIADTVGLFNPKALGDDVEMDVAEINNIIRKNEKNFFMTVDLFI